MSTIAVVIVSLAFSGGAPAQASAGSYDLPAGSMVERLIDGPDGSVVAFYVEPLPVEPFCGVGLTEVYRDLRRVAAFDANGRPMWSGQVPPLLAIIDAYVQPGGAVVIWGVSDAGRGGVPRDALVFRVNALGFDPYFQTLRRSDLGGLGSFGQGLTSVRMGPEGSLDIEGSFSSVRGQPRPGKARLRSDGSLED